MEAPDGPMVPEGRTVLARRHETSDTVTLTLGPPADGHDPVQPAPSPGQFFMLSAFGTGEVPISVSRSVDPHGSVEHTVRAVAQATGLLAAAPVGSVVGARGPFGVGWDLDAAVGQDVIVVAGGIGLAPLRPVIDAVLADRDRYRSLVVLLGARTPADICFGDELHRWAELADTQVAVTVDRAGGPGSEPWTGPIGVVTTLIGPATFDPSNATAFVCGPEAMMRFTVRALTERGVDLSAIQASAERNMKCGVGHCGHCQLGPVLLCQEGPVLPARRLMSLVEVKER